MERTRRRGDGSDRVIRSAASRSSSFFDPIFAAHQGGQAKQDQAAEPDDGSQLHERSEFSGADAFGRCAAVGPRQDGDSAEYPTEPPQPEQNEQDNAGGVECRAQPGIGGPRGHILPVRHQTAVHGSVSTGSSLTAFTPPVRSEARPARLSLPHAAIRRERAAQVFPRFEDGGPRRSGARHDQESVREVLREGPVMTPSRIVDHTLYRARRERIARRKARVACALERATENPEVRRFYSCIVELLQRRCVRTLDEALTILWAEKARTATIESYLGVPRLTIRRETLDEAILALRWLRGYRPINVTLLIEAMGEGPPRRPAINLVAAE